MSTKDRFHLEKLSYHGRVSVVGFYPVCSAPHGEVLGWFYGLFIHVTRPRRIRRCAL